MILFILIEIVILLYTIFADDWLIYHIRRDILWKHSKIKAVLQNVWSWFWINIVLVLGNVILCFLISFFVMFGCAITQPEVETEYSFKINALKDNLVTEGEFHGGMFSMRGYVDGEISYFFSRTTSKGETIGHIPADKTYIRYDDDVHPCIEVHQSQIDVPKWVSKICWVDWINEKTTDYYVIVAPEGTITNNGTYQIDME